MDNQSLKIICQQFRGCMARLVGQLAAFRAIVISLALFVLAIAIDYWIRFPTIGRFILLIILVALIIAAAAYLIGPVRKKWSDLEVLAYLDSVNPQSRDGLVSLYELTDPNRNDKNITPEGRELLVAAISHLAPVAADVKVESAFHLDDVHRWRNIAGILIVLAITFSVIFHQQASIGLRRIFLPWSSAKWPTLTNLAVQIPPGGWHTAEGENFQVVATVTGVVPPEIEMIYRSRSADYWITDRVPVDPSGSAKYTFQTISEPVQFYLRGNDDRTDKYQLDVIQRPRISKITAYYTYPDYAGLADRRIDSGQLRGLEGTKVRLDFETAGPIKFAAFAMDSAPDENLTLTSPTTFTKTVELRQDGQYVIKLTDAAGFREYKPERYDIQVTPYDPPVVQLTAPGKDIVATRQASLKFAFAASDEFGLKQVQFMHVIRPSTNPSELSDKITGPIPQTGKSSHAEFTWDFGAFLPATVAPTSQPSTRPSENSNVEVEYWVAATNRNPTGRGVTESSHFRISLLNPTDFHNQILYEARRVLDEARIGYRNSKNAYWSSLDWTTAAGSGKASEDQWNQIVDLQQSATRANDAVQHWMSDLKEHIERNHMSDAFMENRLAGIDDLRRSIAEQLAATSALLDAAHPKNSADAQPDKLLQTRLNALKKAGESQKLATIGFGEMLRHLYDWENLQTALVNTSLLREREEEISDITRQTAPSTIGREAQDLSEQTLDAILSLSQRQKAALEAETNLENQLASFALKADAEGRATTKRYLTIAYGHLRDIQVNNTLKSVTSKIADNQLSDVAKDQSDVITALKVVEGGLIAAGKNVEQEPAIAAAEMLKREDQDVEVAKVQQPTTAESDDSTAQLNEAEVKKLLNEVVPVGADALSQSLQSLAEDQDDIRSRTTYLSSTLTAQDMPRYKQLKMAMLQFRQKQAQTTAQEKITPLLEKSENGTRLKTDVAAIFDRMQMLQDLLAAGNVSPATTGLQSDVIETSRDFTQLLARQKRVEDLVADHTAKGNVDDFNRPYVLKGEDLKNALSLYRDLDFDRVEEAAIARRTDWVLNQKQAADAITKKIKDETSTSQEAVAEELGKVKSVVTNFSADTKDRITQLGLDQLAGKSVEQMSEVLNHLKDLMDERVAVVAGAATTEPTEVAFPTNTNPQSPATQPTFYTEADLARLTTPEAIRASLEANHNLPPDIKQKMLQDLPGEFPEKYRRLVGAYYRQLLEPRDAQKGPATP